MVMVIAVIARKVVGIPVKEITVIGKSKMASLVGLGMARVMARCCRVNLRGNVGLELRGLLPLLPPPPLLVPLHGRGGRVHRAREHGPRISTYQKLMNWTDLSLKRS